MDEYHEYLKGFVTRLSGNDVVAQDILQELWRWALVRASEDAINDLPLLTWKARRLFYDHLRKTRKGRENFSQEIPETLESSQFQESGTEEDENALKDRFWEQFSGIDLTQEQMDAIWLYARYGYTYSEIAEKMNVGQSTIGDWIKLSRERMRKYIDDQENQL